MSKPKRIAIGIALLGISIAAALGLAPAEASNGLSNGI